MSDNLAATGTGGLLLGGYALGLPLFITVAAGLILVGALSYRWATRSSRQGA